MTLTAQDIQDISSLHNFRRDSDLPRGLAWMFYQHTERAYDVAISTGRRDVAVASFNRTGRIAEWTLWGLRAARVIPVRDWTNGVEILRRAHAVASGTQEAHKAAIRAPKHHSYLRVLSS